MPTPFTTWDANTVRAKLPKRPAYANDLDLMLQGDLWNNGRFWIGELPIDLTMQRAMAKGIVGENVASEILFRAVAAVVGKEPRWKVVLKDGSKPQPTSGLVSTSGEELPSSMPQEADTAAVVDEAKQIEADLTDWWDTNNMIALLQAIATMKASEGHGIGYALIPSGLRDDQGRVPVCNTLADALRYIFIDAHSPKDAAVITDKATRMRLGAVFSMDEEGKQQTDLTYLDDNGNTVLRIIQGANELEPWIVPLGGHLLMHDRESTPILSQQVVQAQKAITLALSQLMRNINLAGHRQETIINAKPPGEWVPTTPDDPEGERQPDGTYKRFELGELPAGPGAVRYVAGEDIYEWDEAKRKYEKVGVTNPNVVTTEPVGVEHFERTYAIFRASAHAQCHQAHVLLDSAAISGLSREQARADFKTSLGPLQAAMDDFGRWLIETTLGIAAVLMNKPGYYEKYRAEFSCILNTGPLSPEEQKEIRENIAADLYSAETGMSMLGIDDVQAEQQRIEQEHTNRRTGEQASASAVLALAGLQADEARTAANTPTPQESESNAIANLPIQADA